MAQRDLYQEVTDNIIKSLEAGVAPWVKPWDGRPRNGFSNHRYRGINYLLLGCASYDDPRWYTFNQCNALGACVEKGSKSTLVIFWKFVEKRTTDEAGKETVDRMPFIRHYNVFNHAQVRWPEGHKHAVPPPVSTPEYDRARALVEAVGVKLGPATIAAYDKTADQVLMPAEHTFSSPDHYWASMLHELVHWTGHVARCDRDLRGRFGTETYAAEELVAELGAAFLCTELGIQGKLQHDSYIKSWLKVLKHDKRAIFAAARLAQQAVDFLLREAGMLSEENEAEAEAA